MREFEKRTPEYHVPMEIINEKPELQVFSFAGFVQEGNRLYLDLVYGLSDRRFLTTIRTSIDDSYTYKIVNYIDHWEDKIPIPAYNIEYNNSLYDLKKSRLQSKRVSVQQITAFAKQIKQIIKKNGFENLSDEIIFENQNIKNILDLDKKGVFEYTSVKKTFDERKPELV